MTLKIAGIKRQTTYSPNHIENDTLILNKTADNIRKLGAEVTIYNEEDISRVEIKDNIIFSMAQGAASSRKLKEIEDQGALMINSPRAVLNCHRVNMVRIMKDTGIPFPESIPFKVSSRDKPPFEYFNYRKVWLKRGDVHAIHREDVTLIYSDSEKISLLREFWRRGIETAILQRHVDGDVIKFYAAVETDLFHWYYLNGINHTEFDLGELKKLANSAARALQLDIYGGDAVISPNGSITIIDMNDWPSFAPIRNKASETFAKLILKKAANYENVKI